MYLGEDKVAGAIIGNIVDSLEENSTINAPSQRAVNDSIRVSGSASKNLFNKNDVLKGHWINNGVNEANNLWDAGNFIKVEPNTQYSYSSSLISGKSEIQTTINYYDNNKNYISNSYFQTLTKTVTTPSNCYYIRVGYRNDVLDNIQLEKGSNITSYEEYYEPKVFVKDGDGFFHEVPYATGKVSKNLFNAYKYKNNTNQSGPTIYSINDTNELSVTYSSSWARLALILTELEPNTDYVMSAYLDKSNYNTSVASGFYDGVYQDNGMTKGSGNVYFTFTTDDTGSHEMQFYGNWSGTTYNGTIIYKNIQLEKGSVPTLYERYFEPTLLIKDSNGVFQKIELNKDNYSTAEQLVGTYLGKPLYKRTFNVTSPNQTSSSEIIVTLASECIIRKYEGMLETNAKARYPLNCWFSDSDYIYSLVDTLNKLKIRVSLSAYASRPIEVTIWYTKG